MDRTESKKIVSSLLAAYTNYRPPDIKAAADVWFETMSEYTYEQVNAGLNLYMQSDSKGFPPVPGQIIEMILIMTQPQEPNEMEAWSLVSMAIRNSGYNSVEEFAKLPPLVQKAVGLPEQLRTWGLDENYNESVVCSHFINCYKSVCSRERELQKMPRDVRSLIDKINKNSDSGLIDQKRKELTIAGIEQEQAKNREIEVKNISSNAPESYCKLMSELRGW